MRSLALIGWKGFRVYRDNVPLRHPGIYRFTCIENGKPYIGMAGVIANRCGNHGWDSPPKFAAALKKYGKSGFVCEPLFYLMGKVDYPFLLELEAELIAVHDSVKNGYNIRERSSGDYGPEFRASLVKRSQSEWRENQREGHKRWRESPEGKIATLTGQETRRNNTDLSQILAKGWEKRRAAGNEKPHRGAQNGQSKLTEEQVLAIRAAEGTEPRQVTADRFDVTYLHVYDIQRRVAWAWLEGPPRPTNRRRGGAYTVAGAAVCSPEQHAIYSSIGGLASAANLAVDPVRRAGVLAQRVDSIKANWDRVKSDPEAYAARCELYKTADHQSPQARENHRQAALIREAKRRTFRELTQVIA